MEIKEQIEQLDKEIRDIKLNPKYIAALKKNIPSNPNLIKYQK
jgi:hypothetical protein